jgi:hypothetical protein
MPFNQSGSGAVRISAALSFNLQHRKLLEQDGAGPNAKGLNAFEPFSPFSRIAYPSPFKGAALALT